MDKSANLNLLVVFHTAALEQSFTRAARVLFLTQPGVSKHIKELEGHYGVRLFDRMSKRVVLTQAGRVLFESTGQIFHLLDEAGSKIDDLRGIAGGCLSIGASVTIGIYVLPGILSAYRDTYPAIDIVSDITFSHEIAEKVLDNKLDLGLVGHRIADDRLIIRRFMPDELVLIVSPRHPWSGRQSVDPTELSDQPFILGRPGSGTRMALEGMFDKLGIAPRSTIEYGNTEGIKKAVEARLGISIVSRHVVERELTSGFIRVVPIRGVTLTRDFYTIRRKGRYLTRAARAFLGLVQKHAGQPGPGPEGDAPGGISTAATAAAGPSAGPPGKRHSK